MSTHKLNIMRHRIKHFLHEQKLLPHRPSVKNVRSPSLAEVTQVTSLWHHHFWAAPGEPKKSFHRLRRFKHGQLTDPCVWNWWSVPFKQMRNLAGGFRDCTAENSAHAVSDSVCMSAGLWQPQQRAEYTLFSSSLLWTAITFFSLLVYIMYMMNH